MSAEHVRGFGAVCPNLEHVPTVPELAARGLAREGYDARTKTRYWRLSAEGARILSDTLRRNGEAARAWRASREEGWMAPGS